MKHQLRKLCRWDYAVIGMVLVTSLVGMAGAQEGGAAILSPRDGDIVSSPVTVELRVPVEGTYQLYVDGDRVGPEVVPKGDVRLTLDVPTGIHELDVGQMGTAPGDHAITVLVDRVTLPDDKNCLTCGGLRRP
ncbi:hypothetical protein [Phaeobacter piscinae]|uniref:hypothetical protein n=1 Tax=Phaeobacter piscinae TaxID=1580596 RepID=UPI000CA1127B|nr:hypothetical protein [Phaeobacter piscinae]AUQ73257.1 hypothetical protein PhaeoP71_00359 [Phaeobacter piscinae]